MQKDTFLFSPSRNESLSQRAIMKQEREEFSSLEIAIELYSFKLR